MPEALNNDKELVDPEEARNLCKPLLQAIDELEKFRNTEGHALANDIASRIRYN